MPASNTTSAKYWNQSDLGKLLVCGHGDRVSEWQARPGRLIAMATLHLIHGSVGSGKTTFARKLEREHRAVRFTHDEWTVRLWGSNPPAEGFQDAAERVWALIWEQAERVLWAGADVILDGGFWSRASRDDARRRAAAMGVTCRLYAMACPREVARQRVLKRTAEMPAGALWVNDAAIDVLNSRVQPLDPDEDHIPVDGECLPPR